MINLLYRRESKAQKRDLKAIGRVTSIHAYGEKSFYKS